MVYTYYMDVRCFDNDTLFQEKLIFAVTLQTAEGGVFKA